MLDSSHDLLFRFCVSACLFSGTVCRHKPDGVALRKWFIRLFLCVFFFFAFPSSLFHDSKFRSILAAAVATAIPVFQTVCQASEGKTNNTGRVNKMILIIWCNRMQSDANSQAEAEEKPNKVGLGGAAHFALGVTICWSRVKKWAPPFFFR